MGHTYSIGVSWHKLRASERKKDLATHSVVEQKHCDVHRQRQQERPGFHSLSRPSYKPPSTGAAMMSCPPYRVHRLEQAQAQTKDHWTKVEEKAGNGQKLQAMRAKG